MKKNLLSFRNFKTAALALFLICHPAFGITPFVGQFKNADGSAMTNPFTLQAWPPGFTWTVNGTNIIYGGLTTTNTPNSAGWFSNSFYANGFRLYVPAYNSYLYGYLPDTTNVVNLATCLSNAPATAQGLSQYGLITNWLGFAPQPLLPYQPATNNPQTFTWISIINITGITNGAGVVTNIVSTFTTNSVNYQHP